VLILLICIYFGLGLLVAMIGLIDQLNNNDNIKIFDIVWFFLFCEFISIPFAIILMIIAIFKCLYEETTLKRKQNAKS